LGIKPVPEALSLAQSLDLDLVEVAPDANPPVCRIMDYGKFKFDTAQKVRESRRKSSHAAVKEMKYRVRIGQSDFETKTRRVAQFLDEGHKVKITIMFRRGRELTRPEFGRKILDRIAEELDGVAKVEAMPRLDGANMTMLLSPSPKLHQHEGAKARPASRSQGGSEEGTDAPVDVEALAETGPTAAEHDGDGSQASAESGPTVAEHDGDGSQASADDLTEPAPVGEPTTSEANAP
jgi:translation initiation factor IF-3